MTTSHNDPAMVCLAYPEMTQSISARPPESVEHRWVQCEHKCFSCTQRYSTQIHVFYIVIHSVPLIIDDLDRITAIPPRTSSTHNEQAMRTARLPLFILSDALRSSSCAGARARCAGVGPIPVESVVHFNDLSMRMLVFAWYPTMLNALRWPCADYLSSPKGDQLYHC